MKNILRRLIQGQQKSIRIIFCTLFTAASVCAYAQTDTTQVQTDVLSTSLSQEKAQDSVKREELKIDYNKPQQYVIADVTITGVKYLLVDQILSITGLNIGDTIMIPGDEMSQVVRKLWAQRYFSDVQITGTKVDNKAYLNIHLEERPRVSRWEFQGVRKGERDDLTEKLKLRRMGELSDYVIKTSTDIIKKFFAEKGFLNATVDIIQTNDTVIKNAVRVTFDVHKNAKVKIKEINFDGNKELTSNKLRRQMKKTKQPGILNIFSSKKFKEKEYAEDKDNVLTYYNEKGFRDATILKDSVYKINDKRLGIKIAIDEGQKYYFRDITWTGNTMYPSEVLTRVLGINKGDVYDVVLLSKMLNSDRASVGSLYQDQGYLFFQTIPTEVNIVQDSVDVEIRMHEGKPATFSKISINGNVKTNEKIIRRELDVRPGYLFSKSRFESSLMRLASSQNYDAEKLTQMGVGYNIIPNQTDETVALEFNVEEKANDQFELSGGWGGNTFIGSVGVRFANFSIRRIFDPKAWRPVPSGDAQSLALKFQTNGTYYTAFSASFMEPWLTSKKPVSLSVSGYFVRQTNANYFVQTATSWMHTTGLSVGIGNRLKWPDDMFTLYNQVSFQRYLLKNWYGYFGDFTDGTSHNLSYNIVLGRVSTDQIVYPRRGSDFSFGLQLTPPYSLFRSKDTDYQSMDPGERYKWIEYHKWQFKGAVYANPIGNWVVMMRAQFGYLGYYNKKLGYSPFEGFILGGDGMQGFSYDGQETIGLRGYVNSSITPRNPNTGGYAGHVYDKFTVEIRHPIIMQGQTQIYAYTFFEGGNAWADLESFNPFSIKRAVGIGVKVMLPVVGILGLDWGYGFDAVPGYKGKANGSQLHFTFGMP